MLEVRLDKSTEDYLEKTYLETYDKKKALERILSIGIAIDEFLRNNYGLVCIERKANDGLRLTIDYVRLRSIDYMRFFR